MNKSPKHSIQPPVYDSPGVLRFKKNPIVVDLLDTHPTMDMNRISRRVGQDFSPDDYQHFMQLIGYSVSGYSGTTYADSLVTDTAYKMLEGEDPKDARIAALEARLAEMREAVEAMRGSFETLMGDR